MLGMQTRMKKLENGVADATFLALAGLRRLGMAEVARTAIAPEDMLPAEGEMDRVERDPEVFGRAVAPVQADSHPPSRYAARILARNSHHVSSLRGLIQDRAGLTFKGSRPHRVPCHDRAPSPDYS